MPDPQKLRQLPSVDEVVAQLEREAPEYPRRMLVEETRRVIAGLRERLLAGAALDPRPAETLVREALERLGTPSLRRVINATGVVLHTNLGRAPTVPFHPLPGYSNLEYDLDAGSRGKRDVHIGSLIERLVGRPGIAVNNNAAAVFLALNELAAGGEVIVSRGELIEIGDGFRIPDIMARSGAVLREVGTTNRTRIEDYRAAIHDRTRLVLRVHPSNFRISGFTAKPALEELAALAREHNLPLYEDLGSGCVVSLRSFGVDEPLAGDSLRAGVNLVSFSGDKLLGGPQAGILAGDPELVARLRRNPMFRVLRLDKLILQALETTLRHLVREEWRKIPALDLIARMPSEIRERAERLCAKLAVASEIVAGQSVVGGGSTPDQSLETWLIALPEVDPVAAERALRHSHPPVVARIEGERLVLDLRTVFLEEEEALAAALNGLVAAGRGTRHDS